MSERIVYIVSILSPDRPGIIADVSDALYHLNGNFQAMSQTIMQGWFTMVLSASFPHEVTREQIAAAVRDAGEFDVLVHEGRDTSGRIITEGEPFIVTAIGEDKPGIVRRLARCCADRGVNIVDVWNEVREGRFITIFHLVVPRNLEVSELRAAFRSVGTELGITLSFQHQDIFTATNSLEVHTSR